MKTSDKEELVVEEIDSSNREMVSRYIFERTDTTFVDRFEWRDVLEKTYNLRHFWYLARSGNQIKGFLGLVQANHPIFGKYLVTAPFATQGGFYADSEQVAECLLDKAGEIQREVGTRYTLIRHLKGDLTPPQGWQSDPIYAS